jgi:hypothetical protein
MLVPGTYQGECGYVMGPDPLSRSEPPHIVHFPGDNAVDRPVGNLLSAALIRGFGYLDHNIGIRFSLTTQVSNRLVPLQIHDQHNICR